MQQMQSVNLVPHLNRIAAYAPAIDKGIINYSSIVQDEPIPNYFDDGTAGPEQL